MMIWGWIAVGAGILIIAFLIVTWAAMVMNKIEEVRLDSLAEGWDKCYKHYFGDRKQEEVLEELKWIQDEDDGK